MSSLENFEEACRLERVINVPCNTHQLALLGWPLCGLSTLNLRHILESWMLINPSRQRLYQCSGLVFFFQSQTGLCSDQVLSLFCVAVGLNS